MRVQELPVDTAVKNLVTDALNPKWYFLVMEGEIEEHENCLGPGCECVERSES